MGGGDPCTCSTRIARPLWAQAERQDEPAAVPRVVLTWGTNGRADGQFDIPIAIVIHQKVEILVTDFRQTNVDAKGRLQRFDPDGRFLGAFEVDPMPGGVALDKEGLLYATHMMRHKVSVYDPAGKLVREFGKLGTAPGEFQQPGARIRAEERLLGTQFGAEYAAYRARTSRLIPGVY